MTYTRLFLCVIIFFCAKSSMLFAAPPDSPFLPGETLTPTCAPESINCTVATSTVTGNSGEIQFNNNGFLGSDSSLTFNSALNKITAENASTTNLTVTNGTSTVMSTTELSIGSLTGILVANVGRVVTALVNLASDITGVLAVANGGVGTSTAPSFGQVLLGNSSGGYDLVSTSSLGIIGDISGTINSGNIGQFGFYEANGTTLSGANLTWDDSSGALSINSLTTTGTTTAGAVKTDKLITNLSSPAVSSCGTSPSVSGGDTTGVITLGTGISVTGCTLTFDIPFSSTPVCTASTDSGAISVGITSISTTAVTFGLSASLVSGSIFYQCFGIE